MFLISTTYQKSRSLHHPDKPGTVVFRISWKADDNSDWIVRTISSDIFGDQDTILDTNRNEIIKFIRLIYCIIEQHHDREKPFTIDDIVNEVRRVVSSDDAMS